MSNLDAQPGDAEQAGGLTDAEDAFWREKEAGRCKSDRGGYYHDGFIDGFLAARASGGPDDGTAERALAGTTVTEWGVERDWGIEWGGSVGMSHNYPYTAESVWGLAGGRPVWKRTRTKYADEVSEPVRAAADTGHQGGET